MASVENKSNGNKSPNQNNAPTGNGAAASVFHPPYTTVRSGGHESSDQSSQGSRSHRSYRPADAGKDVKYSYAKGPRPQEIMMTRSPGYARQHKASHFDPHYRQNDKRHYETFQPAEGREGSSRTDDRRSDHGHQYSSYSRDGPSPGRYTSNYTPMIPEHMRRPPQRYAGESQPYSSNPPSASPFRRAPSNDNKRKALDPTTPEGPRLISNQSSDDSINALLPPKRARSSNAFSDSVLMKSFTPLSPIHSRTFSRDEAIDMSRFMDSRAAAEGMRIFQSWSSGNTPPQDDQSNLDVRLCYNDWQNPGQERRPRNWDEKVSPSRDNGNEQQQQQRDSGSRTPTTKPSRGHVDRDRWAQPAPRQQYGGRNTGPPGEQYSLSKSYRRTSPSQFCQPLHPEDRFRPLNDQLSRRLPPPGYKHEADQGRYWHGDSAPYPYPPVRRGSSEEMSQSHGRRNTPPIGNGWNRYEEYPPNSHMYDHPPMPPHPGQYEMWSDNRPYGNHPPPYGNSRPHPAEPQNQEYTGRHLQSVSIEAGPDGVATAMRTASGILLLSLPEDKISLSETLCIVRENIEVFIATEADVKAPAPGRKRPVVIGQVGLRCIHCRVATHQSEKVKRAVCFPSSIKRIYRTVIDMKLDHFKACRFVPVDFKMKLEQLKATNARSTGTTMQYFVQAAKRMGMVDGGHGIRFCKETIDSPVKMEEGQRQENFEVKKEFKQAEDPRRRSLTAVPGMSFSLSMDLSLSGASAGSSSKLNGSSSSTGSQPGSVKDDIPTFEGKTILACPEDKCALSPLRCFLRENVYAFSATAEDIAVRTPTTFSVAKGQVGIGCIHCYNLPAKERSNRAVCFPFSVGRIYQSVADIQRFHLSECKMVPPEVKERFIELQKASTKGSKGLATRQYWISSAKKLGLVDTSKGIRFGRDPSIPAEKAVSLDILAQVATDVTTSSKPLVLPEDKSQIAGFIYLVMKQLQPCRFTEADRNKRRLKDVGCIGVECKHCAGQVDGRKFFWSSVNAVESNFVSVHTHMMECKVIPSELKDELAQLKLLRKEHTSKLKTGSQKAFFARVWKRLHSEGSNVPSAGGQAKNESVPPQVAVPPMGGSPNLQGGPYSGGLSNVSSPSNSFSDQISSPISESQGVLGSTPSRQGSEKFPLLPLGMSSPSSTFSPNSPESPESIHRTGV